MTPIPQFPQYPSRADPPEEFMLEADAFLAHFPTFRGAANTLGSEMDQVAAATALHEAYATDASVTATAAAVVASGVANYKGLWSTLTGAMAIPASVAHDGKLWTLTQNVADITVEVPGVSSRWVLPYPVRRINIFSDAAANLRAVSSGETIHSEHTFLNLDPTAQLTVTVCGTGGFAAASSLASTLIWASIDNGVTWLPKTMPKSAVWRVMGFASRLYAMAEGSTGVNSIAYSDDNGVNWTAASFAGTWSASLTRYASNCAGSVGVAIISGGAGDALAVTTDSGTTWATNRVMPFTHVTAGVAVFVSGSTIFVTSPTTNPTNYFTSATGVSGSWVTRNLPTNTTTFSQVSGEDRLLAYKGSFSAGDSPLMASIHMLTNSTTFEWTSLNRPTIGVGTGGRPLLLSSSVLLAGVSNSVDVVCATSRIQGVDQRWVPRTSTFVPTSAARNSTAAIAPSGRFLHRIPITAAAEPLGLWE